MTDQLVKRFVAPSMTRALELVQREMGPEAVILSSKRIDKGVEIITSLEPDLPTRGIDVRREFGQNFDADVDTAMSSDSAWRSQAGVEKAAANYGGVTEQNGASAKPHKSSSDLAKEIEAAREKMLAAKRRAKMESEGMAEDVSAPSEAPSFAAMMNQDNQQGSAGGTRPQDPSSPFGVQQPAPVATGQGAGQQAHIDQLQSEIADMRMLLEQQLWQMSERDNSYGHSFSQHHGHAPMPQQINMPKQFTLVSQRLRRMGFSDPLIEELMANTTQGARASVAWKEAMVSLARRIPVARESVLDAPGVYAFLGQTGVGKTTTIAKLAAQYVLKHGPGKVALVTTDTYRVGAFDQLRTMGRILNVPVRVVDRDNSLLTVLASLRQFPLVLIDTAGFRLGDPLLKAQLDQLDTSPSIKRVVVLSCNNQLATMKASVHAHSGKRGVHGCVLTKLDESASIGEALSLVLQERIPVAYTTDGQDIPNDISAASGPNLVSKAVHIVKEQSLEAHPEAL
ncbi:MAG: flagellar biosynthesis protein FlhF [Agarilytica sp.]